MEHRSTRQIKRLQQEGRRLEVIPVDPEQGHYMVASASQPGHYYRVTIAAHDLTGSCSCAWSSHGGINCKHVMAALRERYHSDGQQLSFWADRQAAARQHRRTLAGQQLYATLRRKTRRAA